jgi:hypothetical protein
VAAPAVVWGPGRRTLSASLTAYDSNATYSCQPFG